MKRLLYLILTGVLFYSLPVDAQQKTSERVYISLDKEYYIAPEAILAKFLLLDQTYKPSELSKVGYIEISDHERPYIQQKIALVHGQGSIKIQIPDDIPSGIYELSAYTQYMRNEGNEVFFKKQIAIINPKLLPESQKAKLVESKSTSGAQNLESDIRINTDKNLYNPREQVKLSLSDLPSDLISLVISVSGQDYIFAAPTADKQLLKKQIEKQSSATSTAKWLPEYEGHIITGKILPHPGQAQLVSNISFIGGDIKYINGKQEVNSDIVHFYTSGINNTQEIISTITSTNGESTEHRLDIVSPFVEDRPKEQPLLEFHSDQKQLMDRYIAAQLSRTVNIDSVSKKEELEYYNFEPTVSYNMDDYTRFNTLSKTFLEYIYKVSDRKVNGIKRITLFSQSQQDFTDNVLVLLDGTPIFKHEEMLAYNPRNIKTIKLYDGTYIFANEAYDGIISFTTYDKNLPFFKLNESYQLFKYNCPESFSQLNTPRYLDTNAKQSRIPDTRHTLYWNPSAKPAQGSDAQFTFYTSDLSGEFKITVEGVKSDGQIIRASSAIRVTEK